MTDTLNGKPEGQLSIVVSDAVSFQCGGSHRTSIFPFRLSA